MGTNNNILGKVNEASSSYQQIFQQTHVEALRQNEIQTKRWQTYKSEHQELSERLLSFRDELSHSVMVPIGKRALMKGNLVHTNEVLVSLGDGWMAKQSAKQAADICQRRIQYADEILIKLKKEEELFNTRQSFAFENDAFGGNQTKEVVEEYDEVAEKKWREKHRQKEKEYRQKLAKLKKANNCKIESEQDLWDRLDALDLQEEMEDELNRMDGGSEEEEEEDSQNDESEDDGSESSSDSQDSNSKIKPESKKALKRRVSFKEDKENDRFEEKDKESDASLIRIIFKHSDLPVTISSNQVEITSPADIYNHYIRTKGCKSILKPSKYQVPLKKDNCDVQPSAANVAKTDSLVHSDFLNKHNDVVSSRVEERPVPEIKAVGEVIERNPAASTLPNNERPVSRFKAARMANKR